MVFLCFNYINLKPAQIREYLLVKDVYYSFMVKIFQARVPTKIHRKAAVLSMKSMISYEPERKLAKEIIKFCINTLYTQRQRYAYESKSKLRSHTKTDATMRRVLNMNFIDDQEDDGPNPVP